MKALIIFYSFCILMFSSLIMYISNRNKNYTDSKSGLLEDVISSSSNYKISKSRLLSQNFDNALIYIKMNETQLASKEVYSAIMKLASNTSASKEFDQLTLNSLLKNLSKCYIELARKEPLTININKVFESSELFIAYGYIQKSCTEVEHKNILNALEDINKADECIALSAKYAKGKDLVTHKRLLDNTNQLLDEMILLAETKK